MEESERYLGGMYSPMQLALNKWKIGAGIYVTDKRLVLTGVGGDMDVTFKKIVTGSGRKDFVPANLTPEQNQAIVFNSRLNLLLKSFLGRRRFRLSN